MSASNLQTGTYDISKSEAEQLCSNQFVSRDRSSNSGVEVEEVSQYVASRATMRKKELEQERKKKELEGLGKKELGKKLEEEML